MRSPNRKHEQQYFYKYTCAATAKTVFRNKSLRWSSPLLFNDPFDVTQELRLNFSEAELVALLNETVVSANERGDTDSITHPVLSVMIGLFRKMDDVDRRASAAELRRDLEGDLTHGQMRSFDELREMWREMVPRFRMLCLSESNNVTSMWNHYADEYRGIVLQFEANDELDSPLLLARQMKYQDGPPAIADPQVWMESLVGISDTKLEDLLLELQYFKTTDWRTEREWRVTSLADPNQPNDFEDTGFHPKTLISATFGPACTQIDRDELLALLVGDLDHVQVLEAVQDLGLGRFAIQPVEPYR